MANISSIIWSLMMVEMIALLLCLLAVMVFLRGTFLKRLNARQEVRAEEYLFMIDRTVSFQFRGFADFAAISLIFINLIPNVFVILDSSLERHCSEFSIDDCQQYIKYTLSGLSSLAILDCLILSCAVGRFTKTDVLATLSCYYIPLTFLGLLYSLSFFAPKYETVVTICYRQDPSIAMPNEQVALELIDGRFLHFCLIFSFCAIVHANHSHLTRLAAEMAVSIFEDPKRGGVDKDKSDVLVPSDDALIHIKLDKESMMMTRLFCDDENMRMWRKYFLSSNVEMSVPSVCESLCRFTYERARLYLFLIIYVAFIYGIYYYTKNFFRSTELSDFTCLIFTTLLTFNNIARVPVVAAIDGLKEEETYRKIYNKDSMKATVTCFRKIYQWLRR